MTGILVLILLVSLYVCVGTQVNLDQCSLNLQCGPPGNPTATSQNQVVRGVPGKQGPLGEPGVQGEKGERGERGEPCTCNDTLKQRIDELERRIQTVQNGVDPISCSNALVRHEGDSGGVYTIYPFAGGRSGVKVYCDLTTNGGGWLVFQKRVDGSENFNRGWNDYVNGFGKLDGEFWLGLEKIHRLTTEGKYEMRVDMEAFDGAKAFAHYDFFSVGAAPTYKLYKGKYLGNAGDAMRPNGTNFSTKDNDQDTYAGNCAKSFKGGNWATACHRANPNGFYHGGNHTSYADGVNWRPFRGFHHSLKILEMKIRKI